jgi:hypothetical protein
LNRKNPKKPDKTLPRLIHPTKHGHFNDPIYILVSLLNRLYPLNERWELENNMALFDCNTCSTAKNKEIFNPAKTLTNNDHKNKQTMLRSRILRVQLTWLK